MQSINKKTMLYAAIVGLLISIVALLIFSLDRTSWLFAIFETGRDNGDLLGRVAAIVVELAAVALITSKIVISKQDHPREYRYVVFGLIVVLGVQSIGNLIAGWVRGAKPIHDLFSANSFTAFVAALTWLIVNACIPTLIYILSELLAYVIRLLFEYDRPSAAFQKALDRIKQWRELAQKRRAAYRKLQQDRVLERNKSDQLINDLKKKFHDELRQMSIESAQKYNELLERSSNYHQHAIKSMEEQDEKIKNLKIALLNADAPAQIDLRAVVEWIADNGYTIGDLARDMLIIKDGNKSAAAEAFGTSPVAFGKWIGIRGEMMEDSHNGNH